MARFTKTALGRAEITARKLALDRPTRNLLLIIDPSREGAAWLQLVNGVEAGALEALLAAGLIEPAPDPASLERPGGRPDRALRVERPERPEPAARAGAALAAEADAPVSVAPPAGTTHLDDAALYERLQGVIKSQFGLVQGYRLVLQIERDSEGPALRAAARRVIDMVREQRGEEAAASVAWTLGMDA